MAVALNTDSILWFDSGVWGEQGYACPNPSDDVATLNTGIAEIVAMLGKNLQAICMHQDSSVNVPPSINTLMRIHQLYVRAGRILNGRAVPPGEPRFEATHVNPDHTVFLVFPCPYFKMRNLYMRRWATLVFASISEAMQHTENRISMEISTDFAGQIGKYLTRLYVNMAIELFGKTREEAMADGFLLNDADFTAYNPAEWFTSTEMVDAVPSLHLAKTEDQVKRLVGGIPVTTILPALKPWPTSVPDLYKSLRGDDADANTDAFDGSSTVAASASAGTRTGQPIIPPPPVI